ncbi:SpoIIE family protein phosphatase [Kitasatospora sp. MAP5-34]|uniref:SpoIIE family protein phosphatase n=1 Tax=Kitasatospora sp. MAP5-34 TaxID=3035102 RepID=UPI00247451D8|nr:SpoIIE family protein phosphatase [Kitasatospora sp. MAP5-34]
MHTDEQQGPDAEPRRTTAAGESDRDGLLVVPIATALIAEDGRILHWSPDAEALLGFTAREAVGSLAAQILVGEEQRPQVLELFDGIIGGRAWSGVFPVRHREGHYVNLEFRTHPIAAPDGRSLVLAVASDVTALRRVQEDLAVLDGFFTQSPVGMVVYDPQLRFVRLNEALARVNGIPVAEHVGRRVTEVLPGINGSEVEAVMQRVLDTGEPVVDARSHGRTPGDPEHDHAWSASYFRLDQPDGQVLGVSSTLIDVTERYRAESRAARATERLTLLVDAIESIGTTLDLRRTARELAETMVPRVADVTGVFALERLVSGKPDDGSGERWVRRLALSTVDPEYPVEHLPTEAVYRIPPDSAYAEAMATGRTVVAPSWELPLLASGMPNERLRAYRGKRSRPVQITPLVARGTVLGMVVYSRRGDRESFGEPDITLGDQLVSRAAVAIDNARLYQRQHETVLARAQALREAKAAQERLALINSASAGIGTTLDLGQTARELAQVATPLLADTVVVEVLESLIRGEEAQAPGRADRSAVLRRMAFHSSPASAMTPVAAVGSVHRFHPSTPYAWALAHRRPLMVPRMDEAGLTWFADDPARAEAAVREGVRSLMVVPLIARGAAVGIAAFYRNVTERPYDDEDLTLAAELAARAAVAIDNALLYTRERDSARQLQVALERANAAQQRLALLNEASTRIGTTLDLNRTARELVEVVIPRFADFVTVDLLESVLEGEEAPPLPLTGPALMRAVAVGEIGESVVMAGAADAVGEPSRSAKLYAESLRNGRSILVAEVDEAALHRIVASPDRVEPSLEAGVHSYLMVPLLARGVVLGGAEFIRTANPEPFTAADVALAEELAARAAVCIDNARLYRRERDTALTLQRSLLPQEVHRSLGLEIAYRYLPSSVVSEVGGDWFDVVPLSGGRVALIVGDVMGHGIRAAATMGQLRTVARTLITMDMDPARVMRRLDDAASAGGEGQFATCVCVVYDPLDRSCVACCAGHLPPVVGDATGDAHLLELPPGAPLGIGGVPFESVHFSLPEDGILVLYTDGLVERRDQDLDEGLELLRRTVADRRPTLEQTCDAVLGTLGAHAGAGQDDIAVIMAHVRPIETYRLAVLPLADDLSMVGHARRFVRRTLDSWELGTLVDIAELLTSELITNALTHAGAPTELRIFRNRLLTVEVADIDSHPPAPRRAGDSDEGGRGMHLINELAHRWGSRSTTDGKVVWFELEIPPGASPHHRSIVT